MKIYNKKGFFFGFLWALLGVWLFVHSVLNAEEIFSKQAGNIIVSIILIAVGFTNLVRAFSKKATKKDLIEEQDERNKLLQLKTKSKLLDCMIFVLTILTVIGLMGYIFTQNIVWAFIFFIPVLLLTFYWISFIIINVYYEKKE